MNGKLDATVTLTMTFDEANHLATFIEYVREGKKVDPDSPAATAARSACAAITKAQSYTAHFRVSRV